MGNSRRPSEKQAVTGWPFAGNVFNPDLVERSLGAVLTVADTELVDADAVIHYVL
jgi:hypothetical protein